MRDKIFQKTQITTINSLFNYINFLAKNVKHEMYPFYVWQYTDESLDYLLSFESCTLTKCEITDVSLSAAIYGIDWKRNQVKFDPNSNFNDLKGYIRTTEEFILLNFEIDIATMRHKWSTQSSVGHKFKVLVYKNQEEEFRFRFLQSYISKYSLEEFLNKAERGEIQIDFSEKEFISFYEGNYSPL